MITVVAIPDDILPPGPESTMVQKFNPIRHETRVARFFINRGYYVLKGFDWARGCLKPWDPKRDWDIPKGAYRKHLDCIFVYNNRWVRASRKGVPDLWIFTKTTEFFIEVKGPNGMLSDNQVNWFKENSDQFDVYIVIPTIPHPLIDQLKDENLPFTIEPLTVFPMVRSKNPVDEFSYLILTSISKRTYGGEYIPPSRSQLEEALKIREQALHYIESSEDSECDFIVRFKLDGKLSLLDEKVYKLGKMLDTLGATNIETTNHTIERINTAQDYF